MSLVFRKLGLGGGGIKGILHIGALQQLSKHQDLYFPDGVYGVSIGSIVATYLSFQLPIDDKLIHLTKKYLNFDNVIPTLTFEDVKSSFTSKGFFSMKKFEEVLIEMFNEVGIDIASKKIGDANMPLYIIASNISKGVPTIFSKDVPILDALKCSCCIPGIFKPQVLYNQIYIDGGVFVPCVSSIAPGALVFTLGKQSISHITAETLDSISPIDYFRDIYSMAMNQYHNAYETEYTITLKHSKLMSNSNLDEFNIEDILETSRRKIGNFLLSKCGCQKCLEIFN